MVQAEETIYAQVWTRGNMSCWETLELKVYGRKC